MAGIERLKQGPERVFKAGKTRVALDAVDPMICMQYAEEVADIGYQPRWRVPEEAVIVAAVTGSFFSTRQNQNQPVRPEQIAREGIASVERGACSVHIHVRDLHTQRAFGSMDSFRAAIQPIQAKYGRGVVIDGCAVYGDTFEETLLPVTEGLFETSPVNATACYMGDMIFAVPPSTMVAQAQVMQDMGCKPQIAVYDLGDIDVAERYLIRSKVLAKPYYWDLLFNLPGGTPLRNGRAAMQALAFAVERILEIDEDCLIVVKQAGRASLYLTTLALVLGLHVRVGMEDTVYRYPHRDDLISGNAETVEEVAAIARLLGRRPATADEYRALMRIDELKSHA
jgi:3-keto-5-aminohexanoate cleavage enzyme